MLRLLFRLLAMLALAVAVIMAVLDATRTIAAEQLVLTPLATSWTTVSPDTLEATRDFVQNRMHTLFWDPVLIRILNMPGFVVFAALAFLFHAIGRKPRRIGRLAIRN
ncbi:hypothetical protein [Allomesorhizobium alhagi]|jgi:hypothetical protein|uniref:Uncharacterized protein n=1 Tax=Mesorhizobium alhagi CCNWXJ12-2 TaxID=1107882 RepID=H0HIT6_9HYPH|nr:hypothetical protein [Mesorhizobium alhagi]EHK59353.1 hypothetical protein MAXJ12_00195 [Mesorhizobium alhagi CCNWXJ12-2]